MAFVVFFKQYQKQQENTEKHLVVLPVWVKSSTTTTTIIKENYALRRLNLVKTFPQTHNANRFRSGWKQGRGIKSSQGRRPLQWFPIHFKAKQRKIIDSCPFSGGLRDIFYMKRRWRVLLQFKLLCRGREGVQW